MAKERRKVSPATCTYVDKEHSKLTVECVLPGVSQEDINVNMYEDSINLSASMGDIEYVTSLAFGHPVKPGEAEATYKNGLLKIEVPFKEPVEAAKKVQVKGE